MLLRTHSRYIIARCRALSRKTTRPSRESERVPSFRVCVCFFSIAFHASFISSLGYERVLQWPYHELFRDPNSVLCVPANSVSLSLSLPLSLSRRLFRSLLLSIVSGGLTVNNELYVYGIHARVRARVTKQYRAVVKFSCFAPRKREALVVRHACVGDIKIGRYHRPQMIVSRSPLVPPPHRLFCASTY